MSNTDHQQGYAVPSSYRTPSVLLIYTVNHGKSLGSEERKHYAKGKTSIVIWDFDK
jgi:hypothetical protein